MTSEEYDKLTDNELRIKVAELCGWDRIHDFDGLIGDYKIGASYVKGPIPCYLNDLNACHEFEIPDEKWELYHKYLWAVLGLKNMPIKDWDRPIHNATARQRCKAFVLTMTENE